MNIYDIYNTLMFSNSYNCYNAEPILLQCPSFNILFLKPIDTERYISSLFFLRDITVVHLS